jgi:hypothetical protein
MLEFPSVAEPSFPFGRLNPASSGEELTAAVFEELWDDLVEEEVTELTEDFTATYTVLPFASTLEVKPAGAKSLEEYWAVTELALLARETTDVLPWLESLKSEKSSVPPSIVEVELRNPLEVAAARVISPWTSEAVLETYV